MADLYLPTGFRPINKHEVLSRDEIEDLIETLIARLDDHDGDFDLEDDDPAGDPIELFGEDEPWRGIMLPKYGVDQSAGPTNEHNATLYHQLELRDEAPPLPNLMALRIQERRKRRLDL